jgi:PAS domain S-box-containing protein
MSFSLSLRQSLMLHFVVVAVLPILLLGIFGSRYFEYQHLETIADLNDAHALDVSHKAADLLEETSVRLSQVEKMLRSGFLRNDADINQFLQVSIDGSHNFESIYLLDKDNRITHLGMSERNSNRREDYLGLDLSAHDIFKHQSQLSGKYWSDTFSSAITSEPSITLGIPLEKGLLVGTVSLQKLSTELAGRLQNTNHDFHFSLVDQHGTLIADSSPGLVSQRLNLRQHPEICDALDHHIEASGKFHEDNSLLESVRLVPETNWVAYVSLPVQEARKGLAHLQYLRITVLVFAALLGVVLSLWLSRRMLRPVLSLRDAVAEVAKGNYAQILQPVHYEELEDLSGSIRGMMAAVETRELSLIESEDRFRTVFETNPDAVLITRLSDGQIISVNDACLSIFGYTHEEIIEKTTLEIELWVDLADRDRYLDLVRKQGFVENFEMPLRTKGGRVLTGLTSARILVLNDETCLLAVVRNITQMKEAEARLVRSEARFRALVAAMGDGLLIIGYNGEIVQCNQGAEKILKRKANDIIGKLNSELTVGTIREDGTHYEPNQHPLALTLQTGKSVSNQVMGIHQIDGQRAWLQVNSHPLGLDQDGKPVAVVVSFADVTRLKRIETDLRESEKHMQTLSLQFQGVLEAIPDRIMILDKDMSVIWLNWIEDDLVEPSGQKKFKAVHCYELSSVSCAPSIESDATLCDTCPVKKSFETGRTGSEQQVLPDGSTFLLRTFPVFNELGKVINVIGFSQDITESLRHLDQATRTGQLAALGELAAGVAHEINNPINGVLNYAQLILNKAAADSREADLSQRIIKESERVATIVRELLYFSREESQEVVQITVSEALNEALELVQSQMKKDRVTLQIQLPEDLPMIESRSHQIQQLLLNLISNARYALAEKHPDMDPDKILKITGEEVVAGNQTFVRITVRDEGMGIAAELLPRVMNPFVTSKSSADGTGLGLSISHEIVQKHGGTISIASVHGEYTEVVVELPAT